MVQVRAKEIQILKSIYQSRQAEFVAVYGRRRVGKTHLIREFSLASDAIYFSLSGIQKANLSRQLDNFLEQYLTTFPSELELAKPKDWHSAFNMLTTCINKLSSKKKMIIFFDELPWLATKRSQFLQNLDYYWNSIWQYNPGVKLIVCGSAASWMLSNVVNAKGGLHNRITKKILLQPFNLKQTADFLQHRGVKLNKKQILDIYMVMGGIPYYLQQIEKGRSATQNINSICFKTNGILLDEFPKLFKSLFELATLNMQIIRVISRHRNGISRNQLLDQFKIKSGGSFNKRLEELSAAGFIQRYIPFGKKKKNYYYKIIDEYSLFYLNWIEPYVEKNMVLHTDNFWQLQSKTQSWKVWAGYAFESICFKHIKNILKQMDLGDTLCEISAWQYIARKGSQDKGAQIDLVIDRNDDTISLVEIKYHQNTFTIDKSYAKELMGKMLIFERETKTNKNVQWVIVTIDALKENIWSEDLISCNITIDDLFDSKH